MSSFLDALINLITGQLGSASPKSRVDVVIQLVALALGVLLVVGAIAVFRNLG